MYGGGSSAGANQGGRFESGCWIEGASESTHFITARFSSQDLWRASDQEAVAFPFLRGLEARLYKSPCV